MHYFQLFTYLINSSLPCAEQITAFVLNVFLCAGRAGLRQLPIQPRGWPNGVETRRNRRESPQLPVLLCWW